MPRLYVPIGIPGSGKSSWAQNVLGSAAIVSTDTIRAQWPGGYVADGVVDAKVFAAFHEQIQSYLAHGHVVADATNLTYAHREPLIALADHLDVELHYLMFTNTTQAILRNANRHGWRRVPDDAMLNFVSLYETTLKTILDEPYDSLTYIERVE